jgi:hypothetical protein
VRLLIRWAEVRRCKRENQQPRTLPEIDYLLRVSDETRQIGKQTENQNQIDVIGGE